MLSKFTNVFASFSKIPSQFLITIIKGYQLISCYLPKRCRFYPSCSQYAIEAIKYKGAIKGIFIFISRIVRCHALSSGGYDPVKKKSEKNYDTKY